MVAKHLNWEDGATLDAHSKKKHEILEKYFTQYLLVRCSNRKMERFRISVVDGFSGGGRYKCGSPGSPLILLQVLLRVIRSLNIQRAEEGINKKISIDCLLILNDSSPAAVGELKSNIAPVLVDVPADGTLNLSIRYYEEPFDKFYFVAKSLIDQGKYKNVFFNLDQYGHAQVNPSIVSSIIRSWPSSEVLLTFTIESFLAFLSPERSKGSALSLPEHERNLLYEQLEHSGAISKREWLGVAEKLAFENWRSCANYVSPFVINNPRGWRYWLMHFASNYRARQVFNDVLHNCEAQAHFGRTGLNMLSYDPKFEGQLYLFDDSARASSKNQLYDDIPRFISEYGDLIRMERFYETIYSLTPAHSDDIHQMMIENPDIEVQTEEGGHRRSFNTIKITDTLKLKKQIRFIF